MALRTSDGTTLWHSMIGRVGNGPIMYELDGRQYMVVAGGGVLYSEAHEALARFTAATGIPVGETQAGKGSLRYDHPQNLGAIGVTGTFAANRAAREADVIVGIGTRYSDFTTASKTGGSRAGGAGRAVCAELDVESGAAGGGGTPSGGAGGVGGKAGL